MSDFCYLVIHKACKNLPGVLAAQAAHAAQECVTKLPVDPRTAICVLEAEDSATLEALSKRLTEAKISHTLNVEPDAPWNGAATSLCTSPGPKELVKEFFKDLPLMRKWEK